MKKLKGFVKEKTEKGKKYWNDHKEKIVVNGILLGSMIAGAAGLIFLCKRGSDSNSEHEKEGREILDILEKELEENWDEERFGEKYRKVEEFAENLGLEDTEEFWICGKDCYGSPDGSIEIAHLVDGCGCYPPSDNS